MNLKADIAIGAIAAKVSRIERLHARFVQKHGIPCGVIQVLCALRLNSPT